MSQVNPPVSIVAQQTLWTFRGVSEESSERDFFTALEQTVATEIARRFSTMQRIVVGRELQLRIGNYTIRARLTNLEPLLANVMDETTRVLAQYSEQSQGEGQDISNFVSEIVRYPNERIGATFESLVGLEEIKSDMIRKLTLLLAPGNLDNWARHVYGEHPPMTLLRVLRNRYPLIILEGEVGSGKTALAYSIGHRLATDLRSQLALFVVNAQVRGGGHVGELTQNISRAFAEAERCYEREQIPVLILIDEADALAQARGGNQMHHEDNAGVNTLIQRIDRLRGRPIVVLFATNMAQLLDSAILRRATAVYHFDRPTAEQREQLFRTVLVSIPLTKRDIAELVSLTEPRQLPGVSTEAAKHRYTYSDLVQRIIPHAVEEAFCVQQALGIEHLINACTVVRPTPERQ